MKKHFAKQIFAAALAISFVCGLSACVNAKKSNSR
mgnify:CR=1 FL=1